MSAWPRLSQLANLADDVLQRVRHRITAFSLEHAEPGDFLTKLAEIPQFVAVKAVCAILASLDASNVHNASVQVDL